MVRNRTIRRNIGILTVAQGLSLVCGVASTALLARALGPENYGILGFGTACLAFLGIAATMGTDTYGIREVARERSLVGVIAGDVMGCRLALATILFAAFAGYVLSGDRSGLEKAVLVVQGGGVFVIALTLDFAFQGLERMEVNGVRQVATAFLVLVGVVLFVRVPSDVVVAATVTLAAGLVAAAAVFVYAGRAFGGFRPRFLPAAWRIVLAAAAPMAVSGATHAIISNTDMVMLGLMRTNHEVGLYTAAFRVMAVAFIPAGLVLAAYFPALSAAMRDGRGAMHRQATELADAVMTVGTPVCVGGMVFADVVLKVLYGDRFTDAAPVLVVLLGGALVWHLRLMFDPPLLAWNAERLHMKIMLAGATANVLLNLALIPEYGVLGAATASLLSYVATLGLFAAMFRRMAGQFLIAPAARPIACVVPAALAAWAFRVWIGGPLWQAHPAVDLIAGGALFGTVYFAPILFYRWRSAARAGHNATGGIAVDPPARD